MSSSKLANITSPEREAARTLVSSLSILSRVSPRISPTPIHLGQAQSSTGSQPPMYGARGHTQDIIDLLGSSEHHSSLITGSSSTPRSASSLNEDALRLVMSGGMNGVQPVMLESRSSSLITENNGKSGSGSGGGGGGGGSSNFWTSAQSSSQGAFASRSNSSNSNDSNSNGSNLNGLSVKLETAEQAIQNIAEQGAVALALASPKRSSIGSGKN
tara:strand:+ start:1307 stop:1951 length:645 start_codon:yes stop_codon:yes gene_type:complete